MIKIQRLTEDSSWHLKWNELSLLIDPWLVGSEIDGFKWLNEQWHSTEPVPINDLPKYDTIVVSQSYEDHCHTPTIEQLNPAFNILATQKAYKKLKKNFKSRNIIQIPNDDSLHYMSYGIRCFTPKKLLDPIYYAILITNEQNEGIFYSPHGFSLQKEELQQLKNIKIKILITTFTEFDLPSYLGGKVNPGLNNVHQLNDQIQPEVIINTHDEEKIMKGIVSKKARVTYADYQSLEASNTIRFKYITGYQPVEFA